MFQAFEPVQRVVRLHGDDLNVRIDFFQIAAGAHDRAAGADAGDEVGDGCRLFGDKSPARYFHNGPADSSD